MRLNALEYNTIYPKKFRLVLHVISLFIVGINLSSCIETTEDLMDQYYYQGGATEFSQWYMDSRGILDTISFDKVYIDSIIPKIQVLSFKDMANIADVIKGTSMYEVLVNTNISAGKMTRAFKKMEMDEGIDFYIKARNHFPKLDKVYKDSIMPIIARAPYPVLKKVNNKLSKASVKVELDSVMCCAKGEFLEYVKEELEECRLASIEAYDCATLPAIELGLDSVCEKQVGKVMDKFAGGFMDYRKILIAFGRDMNKFKELWDKYVIAADYQEVIYTYSNVFLNDMYDLQNDYYFQIMGNNCDLQRKSYIPETLSLSFPKDEMQLFEDYISVEQSKGWYTLVDMLPSINPKDWIADLIVTGVEIGVDVLSEEMTPEEKLEAFCQNSVLSQISSGYFDKERQTIIELINNSYNNLYNNIINEI